MDGFEVNKIVGAVLGTALLIILIANVSEAVYHVEPLEQNAYPVDVPETGAGGEGVAAAEPEVDLGTMLAAADPAKGERSGRGKCGACHTFDKGQPDGTGPNLWGVVGGAVAHRGDAFNYSSAMKGLGGEWTYDRLWAFIENPKAYVPGTAMSFVGLPRDSERADVIAWLAALSDSPVPFPAPAPAAEPAPAEEGAATPGEPVQTGEASAPAEEAPSARPAEAPAPEGEAPAGEH